MILLSRSHINLIAARKLFNLKGVENLCISLEDHMRKKDEVTEARYLYFQRRQVIPSCPALSLAAFRTYFILSSSKTT